MEKIKGKDVKGAVEWLLKEGCGCYHFHICDTETKHMHICIGWHDYGDEWQIASKIGMESFNNGMQCDFDIDFDMPYDAETGEVWDTLQEIDSGCDYDAVADALNSDAIEAVNFWLEQEAKGRSIAA